MDKREWIVAFLLCIVDIANGQSYQYPIGCAGAAFGDLALNPADPTCNTFLVCLMPYFPFNVEHKCFPELIFDIDNNICNWRNEAACPLADGDAIDIEPVTEAPPTTTSSTTTTTITTTRPTRTEESTGRGDDDPCFSPDAATHYPVPWDCSVFLHCDNRVGKILRCGSPLVWNQDILACDWPENVDCTCADRRSDSQDSESAESDNVGTSQGGTVDAGSDSGSTASDIGSPASDSGNTGSDTDGQENTGGSDSGHETGEATDNAEPSPVDTKSSNAGRCGRIVCYYTNWAQYRPGAGSFGPDNIDPFHCTHIVYAFAKLNGNRLAPYEWNDDSTSWMAGMYARVTKLVNQNPDLKILLAVGGWNMGSPPFTRMVATEENRQEFIISSIRFLRQRNFHGLDLDWEYPANRGNPAVDRRRFSLLLKETLEAFEAESQTTGRPRLLLTAAVAAGKSTIDTAYEIPELSRYLDFINLMSYDFHGAWDPFTGHNSPLFRHPSEFGSAAQLNVDWAANYWSARGVPSDKLVIGVPFYGWAFTLAGSNTGFRAFTRGGGTAGRFTRESGFLSYYEVCEYRASSTATVIRNSNMRVPYLVRGNQWVGYDDVTSLTEKVDYILSKNYSVMIWSLAMDDFSGQFCGEGRWPLMTAIRQRCGADPVTLT